MSLKPVGGKYEGVWQNELKNGDIAYYINYRDENSRPVKKKVGTKTKQRNFTVKDAYDRLIEIKHKLNIGEELPLKNLRTKRYLFQDAYDDYIEWSKANKKTWKNDQDSWNHLQDLAKVELKELKVKHFEDIKTEKLKTLSPKTVVHILGTARQIFNYVIKHDLVKNFVSPIASGKIKFPKPDNGRLGFISKEQARSLLEALKDSYPRLYMLTVILLATGARFSEVASLRWSDVNEETGMVYFKATKDGNARWIVITPLVSEVLLQLRNEREESGLVIPNSLGKQYEQMSKQWQEVVDKLIPTNANADAKHRITTHSLRHTHASWLAMSGLDIMHIKEQLGHKTLEMTLRYSHLIPNRRHEATMGIFE
jgi:integrase